MKVDTKSKKHVFKDNYGCGRMGMQSMSLFELAMGIVGIVNITVVDSC